MPEYQSRRVPRAPRDLFAEEFMKKISALCIVLLSAYALQANPEDKPDMNSVKPVALIPNPKSINWTNQQFTPRKLSIHAPENCSFEVARLKNILAEHNIEVSDGQNQVISLKLGTLPGSNHPEAYSLSVDAKGVVITAPFPAGLFYGIETLRQLLITRDDKVILPGCRIVDEPAYKIRGLMHDVGRNYQSPALLKEQIEMMARYKYNVFHMHITDNPGWRLESKKHPRVNDPSSMSRKPGKIYTQEEFKDLVKFCRDRHMYLMPELDIPGHTEAFRKALNVKSMGEPKVQEILIDLFEELCDLVPADDMPFIHLGTDEARLASEKVNPNTFLPPIYNAIRKKNRKIIGWIEGMVVSGDHDTINQIWASHKPHSGHMCIDSRSNYVNHMDALEAVVRTFFQKPGWDVEDKQVLGGILCVWPDNRIGPERDVLRQNPVYSSMVSYSETIWHGREKDMRQFWARLPNAGTAEFKAFAEFENRLIQHRDRFFENKEFNYVRNSHIPWRLINFPDIVSSSDTRKWLEDMIKPINQPDWIRSGHDDSRWAKLEKPLPWRKTEIGDYKGAVCYRKTVSIPQEWIGTDLAVELDKIDDFDLTYFNGEFIGASDNYNKVRRYQIPSSLVKNSKVVISVIVLNPYGEGGLYAAENLLRLTQANNPENAVSLGGEWRYRKMGLFTMTKLETVKSDVVYPVEEKIQDRYVIDGKTIEWLKENAQGGTIHLKHFFGFPGYFDKKEGTVYALTYIHSPKNQSVGFWIGFHDWSRSGGRRGGPFPQQGQWHISNPKIWINDTEIAPPVWKQPGLAVNTDEIPWVDENYYYREPAKVKLNQGWNKVLLKVPSADTWKWMFTCVPVEKDGVNISEVQGLTFSTSPGDGDL